MAQDILSIENVQLEEDGKTFKSGTVRVSFGVSFSQDWKDQNKEALENDEDVEGIDVPHVAIIELKGATIRDLVEQAKKPRIISLQNSLKSSFKTPDAFDKGVRDNETILPMVPEGRGSTDPLTAARKKASKLSGDEASQLYEELKARIEAGE